MPSQARYGVRRLAPLDGLRGLAVALVVLYHAGVRQVPGGLLGVDVFFVLSGYLITGLLVAEWQRTGRISLRAFWGRRARRLLPALFLLLPVVVLVWRLAGPPEGFGTVRRDALATLGYVANWNSVLARQSYFAAFSAPSPLLHTWSLGVEEQFYLFWPLIAFAVLAARRSARWLAGVAAAGAVGSAGLMAALVAAGSGADRLYYGTDTRAQALLAGAALGAVIGLRPARPAAAAARRLLGAGGLAGAAGLLWLVLVVDGQSAWLYRGGFALVAAAVTAVLTAVVLVPDSPLARALATGPLAALGRISYGVYLWHLPVVLFLSPARTGWSGPALLTARLAATLAIATASYHLLEVPVRERRWRWPRPAAATVAAAALVVVAVAALPAPHGSTTMAALQSAGPPPPPAPAPAGLGRPRHPRPMPGPSASRGTLVVPAVRHPGPLRVLLVGDSVAYALGLGMPARAPGFVFSNQGYIGCGVARGGATSFPGYVQPPACLTWPQRWSSLVDTFRPDVTLVLLGRWEVLDRVHNGRWMHLGQATFDAYLTGELRLAVRVLTHFGGRVAFLTPPCNSHALADVASPGRLPPDDAARVARLIQLEQAVVARHPGLTTMVPFAQLICPGGAFVRTRDGQPFRTPDGVHLEPYAGALFTRVQLPGVLGWLRRPVAVPASAD